MARASTSAFITMPGPPPAGVSSTVRCRSVACARMSSGVERPDAGRQRLAGEAQRRAAPETSPERWSGRSRATSSDLAVAPFSPAEHAPRPADDDEAAARNIDLRHVSSVNGSISGSPLAFGRAREDRRRRNCGSPSRCRAGCRRRRPPRARSGRRDRTRRRPRSRQAVARHEQVDIGSRSAAVRSRRPASRATRMILAPAATLRSRRLRAILAFERTIGRHRHRVGGERPQLHLAAHAVGGADLGDADALGHGALATSARRRRSAAASRRGLGGRPWPQPRPWRPPLLPGLALPRPSPCAPCAGSPSPDCCASRAS